MEAFKYDYFPPLGKYAAHLFISRQTVQYFW